MYSFCIKCYQRGCDECHLSVTLHKFCVWLSQDNNTQTHAAEVTVWKVILALRKLQIPPSKPNLRNEINFRIPSSFQDEEYEKWKNKSASRRGHTDFTTSRCLDLSDSDSLTHGPTTRKQWTQWVKERGKENEENDSSSSKVNIDNSS